MKKVFRYKWKPVIRNIASYKVGKVKNCENRQRRSLYAGKRIYSALNIEYKPIPEQIYKENTITSKSRNRYTYDNYNFSALLGVTSNSSR